MNVTKSQFMGIIIAILLICTVAMWALYNKKKLLGNYKITNALVNDCYSGGKGNLGTTILYKFNLEGKEETGTVAYANNVLNLSDAKAYILGKIFPVAYESQHPLNNLLLIREKDFKQFNLSMPDTLHWILKYIH